MENNKILIVEDEQRLAQILKKNLEESGFKVEVAYDGYIGKQLIEQNSYNIIILDINLPQLNGFELCREIRKTNSNIPIIMLTAMGTTNNKITGFDAGADDYILKPVDYRELLARVNVFLRRSTSIKESEKLTIADLEINLDTKTIIRAGKKIELTSKEFALLVFFLKNKNKILSREYTIQQVWDIEFDTGTNIIDVYVNYLRKKIDRDFEPKLIHNRFGFGYYCSEKEI
ncbi:MAG: response regulator transcription factor [Nitrosarchaeum sp.]|nr:response regulator transcription factor [Nitrosarchaeum sp.]